jgi:hypothetical protein
MVYLVVTPPCKFAELAAREQHGVRTDVLLLRYLLNKLFD